MKKQADGRYRTKVKVGNTIDGKPVYKWASGRTQKELDENKKEIRKIHINGNTENNRDVLFGVFAQQWYDAFKKSNLAAAGQAVYATMFNAHLFPAFADKQIRAITSMQLQQFLNSKQGMSKSSIDKLYAVIKQMFKSATAQYIIDRDPALALTKPDCEEQSRRALTEAEIKAALHLGTTHPDGLLLLLCFYTGARIGEVVGLKWSDIDFNAKTISIERDIDFRTCAEGELKTAAAERTIPAADQLLTALRPLRGIGYILQRPDGQYLSNHALRSRWERLMMAMYKVDKTIEDEPVTPRSRVKKYQKPDYVAPRKSILTPHYFRHNYVSILYNADVDVLQAQKWCGHKDIKTTLGIYSHLSEGKEEKNVAKFYSAFEKF